MSGLAIKVKFISTFHKASLIGDLISPPGKSVVADNSVHNKIQRCQKRSTQITLFCNVSQELAAETGAGWN
jgi:hypothetical protein